VVQNASARRASTGRRHIALVALAAIALGPTLAACGDDADPESSQVASATRTASNGDVFNQADVDFATHMIPHHAQAIQMVTLTDTRQLEPPVQELANRIREAQAPEVETMTDWLTAWGKDIPATPLDHAHGGHDPSEMTEMDGLDEMPGMLSAAEMEALADAPDAEFQDMWLELMKKHHEGAIEMARQEQEAGEFPAAVALADSIISAQQAEIEEIDGLLGR